MAGKPRAAHPAVEAEWAADRERCLQAFREAVSAARERDYAPGLALVERVRQRGGDAMAAVAGAELRRHTVGGRG